MRICLVLGLAACLAGCAAASGADRYLFHGAFAAARDRGRNETLYRRDFKACGAGPGAEWCRLAADDGNLSRIHPAQDRKETPGVAFVFDQSQCVGVMEHGLCKGMVKAQPSATPVCHGQMIDGVCSGPEF